MRIQFWGVVAVLLVVGVGCGPKPLGVCGGKTCADTERCDPNLLVCVEDLPPVITLVVPPGVVSESTFVVSGTVVDDAKITKAEWRVGSGEWTVLEFSADGGTFSETVDSPLVDARPIAVSVRLNDGVNREVTKDAQVTVDRVGPVIELVSPAADSVVGASTLTASVRAIDGSGSLSSLSIAGTPVTNPVSGEAKSVTVNVPPDANHTPISIAVTASDARGNASTASFSFFGDRVGPIIEFVQPAANQYITTASFLADVIVTEPGTVQSVAFRIGTTDVVGTKGNGGHWTASLPAEMVERDDVITVTAIDDAMNSGSATRTVGVDRIVPTVAIMAPASGSIHRAAISVSAQTTGATSVIATLEGQMTTLAGGPTSWSGMVTPAAHDFAPAMLQVRAVDAAGNEATAAVPISTDTAAPVVTFTAPTAGRRFNATDLASSSDVTTSWTVQDADSQVTTLVNGASSTATMIVRPTSPLDNPTTYTTTVVVTDRAGNATSQTLSYSVDRAAPVVIASYPPNLTRNLYPRSASIDFSEPMIPIQALQSSVGAATGTWTSTSHFDLSLESASGRVVDVTVNPALADTYGNPLTPPALRKIHVATGFNPGALVTLAPNVAQFDVTTDTDGVANIALITTTAVLTVLRDKNGSFVSETVPAVSGGGAFPVLATRASVNSWNSVDPVSLVSTNFLGMSTNVGGNYYQSYFTSPVQISQSYSTSTTPSAVLSMPPLLGDRAGGLVGGILSTTYSRSSGLTYTLPLSANMIVSQSNTTFAALNSSSSTVQWTRVSTHPTSIANAYNLNINLYGTSASNPTALQSALTRSGSCLGVTWDSGATRYAVFQAHAACEDTVAGCTNNTALTATAMTSLNDLRVGTFDSGNENTLIFSYRTGSNLVLAKMDPNQCGFAVANVLGTFSLPGAKAHAPARIGPHAALLYIDASDNLKLQIP